MVGLDDIEALAEALQRDDGIAGIINEVLSCRHASHVVDDDL